MIAFADARVSLFVDTDDKSVSIAVYVFVSPFILKADTSRVSCTSTIPVPFADRFKLLFVCVHETVFPSILTLSISNRLPDMFPLTDRVLFI